MASFWRVRYSLALGTLRKKILVGSFSENGGFSPQAGLRRAPSLRRGDPSKSPMKVNDAARARQRPREPSGQPPTKDARPRDDLDREVRRVDKKSRNQSTFVDMRPTAVARASLPWEPSAGSAPVVSRRFYWGLLPRSSSKQILDVARQFQPFLSLMNIHIC